MKKAKLFFAAGLMAMSLFTGLTLNQENAKAAEMVKCELTSVEGHRGDTVSVTVKVVSNLGTIMSQNTFSYDSNVVEVTNVKNLDLLTNDDTVGQPSAWTAPNLAKNPIGLLNGYETVASNSTKTGDMYIIELKIKDNAPIGESSISFGGTFCDYNFNDYNVSCNDGKVKVLCGHESVNKEVVKNPTCTEKGQKKGVCTICGEVVSTSDIVALGHTYGEWTVATAATCTEKGTEKRTCTVCGAEETRETEALGHTYGEWTVATAATCTEKGTEKRICTVCGAEETRETEALGHTYGEWTVVTAATCTEKGTEKRTCTACGAEDTRETEALGHTINWTIDKEATETEEGHKSGVCELCEETFEESIPVISNGSEEDNNNSEDNGNNNNSNNNNNQSNNDNKEENKDSNKVNNDSTDNKTANGTTAASDKKENASSETPVKTGDAGLCIGLFGMMAVSVAAIVIAKKKERA